MLNNYDPDDDCYSNYHDCTGICDGDEVIQTYWNDDDGDGLGDGIEEDFCSANVPDGWVLNNNDLDDNCYSNFIDQCGVCDGDDSSCSGCTNQEAFNYGCYGGEIPPCNDDITIDDGSCIYAPEKFNYNQSQMQAFYIIENVIIHQEEIEDMEILTDWIGVFKDSVCVGAYPWTGYQTTLPAMGYDGSSLTENYLISGDYPTFYIFDSSEDEYMTTAVTITDIYGNDYNGWGNFEFFFVEEMVGQGPDCSGLELGPAFSDDCGICICGYYASDETPLGCLEDIPNIDLDCSEVCEPSTPVGIGQAEEGLEYGAFEDNCGVCSEGSTDHIADSDELGCGCFNPPPEPFWPDIDSDGFGFGDYSIDLCLDNVTELYADNNLDTEPSCPNPNPETSMIDDCGDCVGLDVSTPNENMDLFGVCCEAIEKDLCGVCFGNDSYCNQPVAENQNIETQEDNQIQIVLSANDPNDDPIFYSIFEEPGNGILLGAGQNLIYIPNSNFNGIDSFTFTASDGNWTSELGLVTINVHPVNDPPEVIDIIITVLEDSVLTFDLPGYDVDGDDLSYTLSALPINGSATLSGNQVQYTPNPNYFGLDSLSYAVSDSEYTSPDGTINIFITPVPDAPYLSSIPDTSIIEGESFSHGLNFGDADGDELFLFVQTDGNSNAEIVDEILFVTPQNNYFGDIQITVTASDGEFDVNQSFTLSVIPINDPPVIMNLTDQTILEDSELTVELNASDPDGDDLSFDASTSENAEVIISGNTLNIIPVENFNGELIITVSASDNEFSDSTQFALNILPVNDAPEFTSDPILEVFQGELYEYAITANDVDGDELSFSISSTPQWLNFSDTIISGIPGNSDIGEHSINVTLSDGELVENQSYTLTVLDVNDPPMVGDLSITVEEDNSVTIILLGVDLDGDELTYSITNPPSNGSAELEGNEVIYTPNPNYYGSDDFGYTAYDGEYSSDEGIVNITIIQINDPPNMAPIPDMEILEGDTLVYPIEYSNIDGEDENILFFAQTEEGSTENEDVNILFIIDGILNIIPLPDFNGDIPITVVITDGIFSVSESFVLTVIAVNDPPILAGINDQEINEDSELIVELIASDIDGDELTFYVSPVAEALLSIENNYLTLTPVLNYFGDINVLVSVSDGELTDSTEFSVNVLPVNDPPELINEIDNISVSEGAEDLQINLIEIFYDVENGSELAYSVSENVNGLSAVISESILTLSFEDEAFGSGVVEITASDNISRATASTSFNVEIIPIDDPPIVDPVSVELDEDTDLEITLTATDPEGYNLEYSIIQSPENGSLTILTGSTYLFTPAADYSGSDTFIFRVSDGENQVDETAIIIINAVNDNPFFITESLPDALENSEYEANILIDDVDNFQNELSLSIVSGPEWLELDGFVLGGTPDSNDDGYTDVTLELSDGLGSVSWTATLFVENANSAPVVENININVEEDSFVEFTIYASDPEGGEISYNLSNPANGVLTGTPPYLTYTPDLNFYGEDEFTFTAFDGDLDSDTAWVNVQVIGINDNPVAGDLIFEVDQSPFTIDFSTTVFDPDGDDLTIITVPPSPGDTLNTIFGGTLIPIGYLLYEYNPPIEDSDADFMLYKASDGTSESDLFMVTFNLYGRSWSREFPPIAFDDIINMAEDESKEITLVGFDVFYNFPLDGTENVNITQSPQHGNLDNITFSSESTNQLVRWNVNYTPNSDYYGEDEIRYIVENPNNDNGASEEAIISININPVNDLPQLDGLADVQLHEDSGLEVYFSANDSDNDLEYNVSSSNESIAVSTINDSTISIIPVQNYNGSGTITVTATELGGDELSTSQIFTVDVLPVNDDPVLTFIDDVTVIEDESAIVSLYATDVDYVSFTYSAVSNTDDIQVSISNNLLTLTSSNDFNGVGNILITVVDNESAEDSQDVFIEFLPVNDAPVLSDISNITLLEDTSTEIILSASDVDSPDIEFSVLGSEHISVLLNGNILSVTPTSEWSGSETINIIVSDGELSESSTVTVTVLPVNDPPVLSPVSNQDVDEDNSVDVFLNANDSDGDYLIYTVIESGGMGTAISGNVITLTPPENYYGETSITVSVNDGVFADSTDFTLTVKAVNDAPIVSQPLEDIELLEDSGVATVVLSNVFTDVDGDSLVFSVGLSTEDIISAEIDDGNLIISTLPNQNGGPVSVTITADDEQSSTPTSDTFIIDVIPINDPPILSDIENQEINEGSYLFYSIIASDIDGDNLVFSADANIDVSINLTGNILSLTPSSEFNGDIFVTVTVSDGEFTDSTDFTLTVKAVNDAPIVSQPLEDIELLEDSGVAAMVLSNVFTDVDGDNLVYEAAINLNGIIFIDLIGNNLYISTLLNQFGGPITITITADDQQGATPVIDQFEVIVLPVNDPPIITSIPDSTAWEDIEYTYHVELEDVDSDIFYFNLGQAPEGMAVDNRGGLITWTPLEGVLTSGLVVLYIWDVEDPVFGIDIPIQQIFTIDVIPVNDPPIIISTAHPTATEDELYLYQVLASDPDDVEFGYTLTNQPMGMTIDSVGLILWTPVNGVLSSGTVTISVNDGGEDNASPAEQDFFIVVIPVNDPPVIISTPLMTELMVSNTFFYQVLVEDIDDDEFSYVLIDSPQGMTIDETGYLIWVPQYPGEYGPITILAADGGEDGIEPASQEIYILVTPYTDMITMNWEFSEGANLISYLGIPGDSTVQTAMAPLGDWAIGLIGEANAALLIEDGIWIGSLQNIKPTSGYWLTLNLDYPIDTTIQYSIDAFPTNPALIYNLHVGPNLTSYVGNDGAEIGEALPDDIEGHITGIISAGVATMPGEDGEWMGSLQNWNVLKGYWISSDIDDLEFSFVSDGLVRKHYSETKVNQNNNLPDQFSYEQSTQQSFYFVDAVMVDGLNIHPGEWILATHNGTVVGAREWNGEVIDVPVMGTDGNSESSAYCAVGDIPEFKLYRPSTGELIDLTGEISSWANNAISFVGLLENVAEIPDAFRLGNPYPNPFNPTTSITFDVASECELELSIFDIQGRLIEELVSGLVQAGYYEIQWNASGQASGMYFLRMVTPESAITQKLILMK